MADSSDSEEFYDAEEFTPVKGSKRSSLCKSISVTESGDAPEKTQDKGQASKTTDLSLQVTGIANLPSAEITPEDDRTTVKNVVQGRRRFQELRRCMQTEEEDEGPDPADTIDHQPFTLEHPFKIISHDTMSLQSMTSLGRIGRLLSGASESHRKPNIRESAPLPSSSREPSTISDDPLASDSRTQNVLAMAEPDVIASTKANSLKQSRASSAAIVAVSGASAGLRPAAHGPVAPPRKKKRNKLHGSQSLSVAEGDNVSVCTTDTDEYRYVPRRADKPHLDSLLVEPPQASSANQSMALPSPASTIESLTREFQDSLELSSSKYAVGGHEPRATLRQPDPALDLSRTHSGKN